MENDSLFEERFNLVMELNKILEEIGNLNKELNSIKKDNIGLHFQNSNNKNIDISKINNDLANVQSKNEFLKKESKMLDDNIIKLKNELNNNS